MADPSNIGALSRRSKLIDMPDGSHLELSALVLSDYAFIQEEAASAARRELIKTYADNAEYLPAARREELILEAFNRAEEIRSDTIDTMFPGRVANWMNRSMRGRLCCIWRSMLPGKPGLSYDEASELWSRAGAKEHDVDKAAEEVGQLSRATVGNASPPPPKPEAEGAMAG